MPLWAWFWAQQQAEAGPRVPGWKAPPSPLPMLMTGWEITRSRPSRGLCSPNLLVEGCLLHLVAMFVGSAQPGPSTPTPTPTEPSLFRHLLSPLIDDFLVRFILFSAARFGWNGVLSDLALQCCGCNVFHKLVDNLNLFEGMKCYVNPDFLPKGDGKLDQLGGDDDNIFPILWAVKLWKTKRGGGKIVYSDLYIRCSRFNLM